MLLSTGSTCFKFGKIRACSFVGGWFAWRFYVTVMVLAFPRLGPALTFGLAVAGQLLISLLLDHFNVLVPHPHPINLYRILGILLIISGVVIIRKF
jgi:transporter family-2 protein